MKLVLGTLACAAAMMAAPQQANPPAKKKSAAASAPANVAPAKRMEIPAGAVERDGRFYYTDPQGKKWIYVRTPFGASRMEDKPEAYRAPVKAEDPFANVKITESGDTVTFERPGAFGVSKWQRKKSELTDEEKAALARSHEPAKSGEAKQDR